MMKYTLIFVGIVLVHLSKAALPTGCDATGVDCPANSNCADDNNCACDGGFKLNDAGDGCVAKDVNEFDCTEDGKECEIIPNAECNTDDDKCTCKLGFNMNANTCVENSASSFGIGSLIMVLCYFLTLTMKKV